MRKAPLPNSTLFDMRIAARCERIHENIFSERIDAYSNGHKRYRRSGYASYQYTKASCARAIPYANEALAAVKDPAWPRSRIARSVAVAFWHRACWQSSDKESPMSTEAAKEQHPSQHIQVLRRSMICTSSPTALTLQSFGRSSSGRRSLLESAGHE